MYDYKIFNSIILIGDGIFEKMDNKDVCKVVLD